MTRQIPLAVILLALASVATAATLNVPSQYATIQAAVDAAQTNDVVLIAPGTFTDVTHLVIEGIDSTYCSVIMKSGITATLAAAATMARSEMINSKRSASTSRAAFTLPSGWATCSL